MDRTGVVERVERVSAVTADAAADVAAIESALVALQQVQAWADAQHATLVPRLASQVSFPEQTIAESSKCSLAAATKSKDRSDTLEHTPELAGALADGAITAGDLGRTTRLASRAQRRALRAMYLGCAIPGCSVSFDRCKLHHLQWWRHGGRTDLANLLPICTIHHTKLHHDGWIIELGPNRELSLRLPDGSIHNTGPPSRRAA